MFVSNAAPPLPFTVATQLGLGASDLIGGGYNGAWRIAFTPTSNFHITGLAFASGAEYQNPGNPPRVARILASDNSELSRSAVSTTSYQGVNAYTPGPELALVAPVAVVAGTMYWAETTCVNDYIHGYLNRRASNHINGSGPVTWGISESANAVMDGSDPSTGGATWANPQSVTINNQGTSECVILAIYGY
jgi:hypothetical protein